MFGNSLSYMSLNVTYLIFLAGMFIVTSLSALTTVFPNIYGKVIPRALKFLKTPDFAWKPPVRCSVFLVDQHNFLWIVMGVRLMSVCQ